MVSQEFNSFPSLSPQDDKLLWSRTDYILTKLSCHIYSIYVFNNITLTK